MDNKWMEHYEAGKVAYVDNNYAAALEHLEEVVKEKDSFADVFNMLGIIYYYENRTGDAISSLKRAIQLNPRYIEAYLNLSVVYNEAGEFDKGQDVYMRAKEAEGDTSRKEGEKDTYLDLNVKGKLANMHAGIGDIYKDLGHYTEASCEYKKALALSPGFVDIMTNLAIVYRDMKDFSKAVKQFEEACSLKSEYTRARTQLGLTYYAMGEKEKAKSEWKKVLKKNPDDKFANMYMNLLKEK